MIFSLVSSAQEWLNERWDDHKKVEENRKMEKQQIYEEEERVSHTFHCNFCWNIFKFRSSVL